MSDYWSMVEQQEGPECGFEALENLIQCYWPVANAVSEWHLKPVAQRLGYMYPDGSLDPAGYIALLQGFKIDAQWYEFDHGTLISALKQHRRVIAVVDAHEIDSIYPPDSGHAIVLTRSVTDASYGIVYGYRGFDSNHQGQECQWAADAMERAAGYYAPSSLLVTALPVPARSRQPHLIRRS